MDDPVPAIDFSPSGGGDSPYSLEREDVDGAICLPKVPPPFISPHKSGFLHLLDDLEQFARSSNDPVALNAIRESRAALDKLVSRMDNLESAFDRIAERSCSFCNITFQV